MLVISAPQLRADDKSKHNPDLFEKSIRPLLVKHCIKCHGPKKAESGLRLDSKQLILKGGDSGPAISVESAENSLIVKALRHLDDLEMPPTGKRPDQEIEHVVQWIRSGAHWPEGVSLAGTSGPALRGGPIQPGERKHWAYQPITDPNPPDADESPGHSAIDRFLNASLQQAGLKTMPQASRRTWIRRATFDLTGLPPTPDEIQAFEADQSASAYAKVINRLLDTQAYGERWGRHWLDVVRYSDTAGETADYPTPLSYKYRNWVIQAFNQDMPYDNFLRQQLAGDILAAQMVKAQERQSAEPISPEAVKLYNDLMSATGFIAISRRFGFDVENYHYLTIQDTIDVVGQSMLGLTLGCVRCHDHKYDPVNMSDYYGWYGIFESTRYSFPGSEEKKRPYDLYPGLPESIVAQRQKAFDAQLADLNAAVQKVDAEIKTVSVDLEKWSGSADYFGFEDGVPGPALPKPYTSLSSAVITESAQSPFRNVVPAGTRGISFPSDNENNAFGRTLPRIYAAKTDPLLYYNIDFRNTSINANGQGAYRFYLGHGPGNSGAVEMAANQSQFLVKDGSNYVPVATLKMGEWYNLQVTLDLNAKTWSGVLSSADSETRIEAKAFTTGWDGIIDYTFVDKYGPGIGPTPAHDVDNLRIETKPFLTARQTLPTELEAATNGQKTPIADNLKKMQSLRDDHAKLTERLTALKQAGPIPPEDRIYGVVEQDKPVDSRIQLRGEITRPGDVVPRRNLEILGHDSLPDSAGSGRLQMADWITRDSNPLMARVMVNRIWQQHFGRGLVGSANDFGARGERPSHPELLDWLASRFQESGYSVKAMHRLIMNTQAYQRSSQFDATANEKDPDARLIWRFNRRRLSAEEIRDAMLATSGSLDRTMGHEHPFPLVETWGFSQHGPFYGVYETNRRSVYLMQQRLKRHPFLGLFDGADTNVSTAHRELTTVPTQALFLMNNEFVHEQATALAQRLQRMGKNPDQTIENAYWLALGRMPTAEELADELNFMNQYRESASSATTDSNKTSVDLAAWSALARSLLTRNEFLFID